MNDTHSLLHGNYDSNHTSTLYAYWIYYPTPWPFLLGSVLLSVALGFVGLQSSAKSWRPMNKKNKKFLHHGVPQMEPNEMESSSEQPPMLFDHRKKGIFSVIYSLERPDRSLTRQQRRDFMTERRRFIDEDCQRAALAEYRAAGIPFNPEHDQRVDGGLGKATLTRTMAGIAWTTMRAASIFALAIRITRGSKDTYPGIVSVVILFCSAQTYLATRAMPRAVYLLVVLDLMAIYAALILMIYGILTQKDAYGKVGIQGGECPWLSTGTCSIDSLRQNGCIYNSTWDTMAHGYPPASPGSNSDPNPNIQNAHGHYHLPEVEVYVGLAGALYGILVMLVALSFIQHLIRTWREFWLPFPAIKMASAGRLFYSGNKLAFGVMLLLALVTLVVHLLDELHGREFNYADSFGPNIYSSGSQGRLQANGSSWSDCFTVKTPVDKWGSISAWWNIKESRAVRLLAGI